MVKLADILFLSILCISLWYVWNYNNKIEDNKILTKNSDNNFNTNSHNNSHNNLGYDVYDEIRKPLYPYHIDILLLYISRALNDIKRPFHIIAYDGDLDRLTIGIFRTDIVTKKSLRKAFRKYDIYYEKAQGDLNSGLVYKFKKNNTEIIVSIVYQMGHGAWLKMFSNIHDNYILNSPIYNLKFFRYEHAYGINNLLVLEDLY